MTYEWQVTAGGVDQEGRYHQSVRPQRWGSSDTPDLDGDGVLDAWVPVVTHNPSCPADLRWDVYIRRGTCGHRVGRVTGLYQRTPQTPAKPGSRRLSPIVIETSAAAYEEVDPPRPPSRLVPIIKQTIRTYRFNGRRYALKDTKTSDGQCHHCSVTRCTGPKRVPPAKPKPTPTPTP